MCEEKDEKARVDCGKRVESMTEDENQKKD